jgi:serine/threonine-protein kinase
MVGVQDFTTQRRLVVAGAFTLALSGCYQGIPLPGAEDDGQASGSPTPSGDSTGGVDTDGGTDGDSGGTPGGLDCAGEAAWTRDILEQKCAGCHTGATAQGNFDYVTDLTRLVTSGQIRGGDPENSPLFQKVSDGLMPPAGVGQPFDADQTARLSDYIEFCADDPAPECGDNEPVTFTDQLRVMAEDLSSVDLDDRPFTRYFVLTHLHNAGYCKDEVDLYRYGVAKLLNSLSTAPTIVTPVPVDDLETIYRVDLRDYDWDEPVGEFDNKWDALVAASPFAVERLEDEAETLKTFAGSDVPFLLGDAFIEVASQTPLYHDLAGIPATLGELETQLGLSIAGNVADEEVQRAGVLDSGVSRQNRIVERHDIPSGFGRTFWLSYDFADDSLEEQNIFSSPLDFESAGGEVIFNLPNGMQAYVLVDNAGNRLDVAPDAIVTDPKQEDNNVHNGISCFGCHSGIIPAVDEVRDHVLNGLEFDAQTKDTVSAIYPPVDEMTTQMDADTQRYQNAILQSGAPIDLPLEPISEAFLRRRFNVSLTRAAAELGISEETLLTQLGGLDPSLGTLVNGSIKRDTWNEVFPQTVCALRLGRTEACATGDDSSESTDTDGSGTGTSG